MDEFSRIIRRNLRLADYVMTQMEKPWQDWPTVRDMAIKYHCKQDDIIEAVESSDFMDLIVGMKNYNGHGEFENKADYRIEWFDDSGQ